MLPAPDFMDKLERLRVQFDKPMPINSAARCSKWNALVSQTGDDGPHTTGRAVDIGVRGADALLLIVLAARSGFTGVGVQQKNGKRFVHLDDLPNSASQPRPHIWTY